MNSSICGKYGLVCSAGANPWIAYGGVRNVKVCVCSSYASLWTTCTSSTSCPSNMGCYRASSGLSYCLLNDGEFCQASDNCLNNCDNNICGSVAATTTTTTTAATVPSITNGSNCSTGFVYTGNQCTACGLTSIAPNIKIIGGVKAVAYSWPAQAQLHFSSQPGYFALCGGTLISRQTVLTAAHCVIDSSGIVFDPTKVSVYLGVFDNDNLNTPYSVAEIIMYPNYDGTQFVNDIALLILSTPVTLGAKVQLACLPAQSSTYPSVGSSGYAVGWGVDNMSTKGLPQFLYNVKLPINDPSQCYVASLSNSKSQICAGSTGVDTCQGDSGGPLYVIDPVTLRYVVSGVTSYGVSCGVYPGVYTRVSYFTNWITDNWVV